MSKILHVAANEYRSNVIKRSFLLSLLSLPLFLTVSIGSGLIMESLNSSKKPIGYIDHADVIRTLDTPWLDESDEAIPVLPFANAEEAEAALKAEQIQGYFTIPADYRETGKVNLTIMDEASEDARAQFSRMLRYNVALQYNPHAALRISEGTEVEIETPDSSRSYPAGGPPFSLALPLIVSGGFVFVLLMSSGYAMGAVAGERETRTMEVLVTSIRPGDLLRGKLIGILGISLTLIAAWTLIGIAAVFIGGKVFDLAWLKQASVDWGSLGAVLLIALPNYVSALAVMITVGSTVGELQEGQALTGIFLLVFFLPIYVLTLIGQNPSGTFSVILSFIPFMSLMTMGIRNMFVALPIVQLLLSFTVQVAVALFLVWLSGRAFRIGMLRIGQRTRLRDIFGRERKLEAGGAV
ncbi:MAG: ABC transporter permease [Anaerolineales bacterium]